MMTDNAILAYIIKHQALIAAQIAKIEGMKAANAACFIRDEGPLYEDRDFQSVTDELSRLGNSVQDLMG